MNMGDNQKYTTIKIRTLCTACGNDCGDDHEQYKRKNG